MDAVKLFLERLKEERLEDTNRGIIEIGKLILNEFVDVGLDSEEKGVLMELLSDQLEQFESVYSTVSASLVDLHSAYNHSVLGSRSGSESSEPIELDMESEADLDECISLFRGSNLMTPDIAISPSWEIYDPAEIIESLKTIQKSDYRPKHAKDVDWKCNVLEVAALDRDEILAKITHAFCCYNQHQIWPLTLSKKTKDSHDARLNRFVKVTRKRLHVISEYDHNHVFHVLMVYILLKSRVMITKRNYFYMNKSKFRNQKASDHVFDEMAMLLGCRRTNLPIFLATTGMVVGLLTFEKNRTLFDCKKTKGGLYIPYDVQSITKIKGDKVLFILVVEKHTIFSILALEKFYKKFPCIIITGFGMPDLESRELVAKLYIELKVPVFVLCDCDPHGIAIMCTYKYGSANMSYDNYHLACPDLKWIGLRPSDLETFKLLDNKIDMTDSKKKRLEELLHEEHIPDSWKDEMLQLRKYNATVELDTLVVHGFRFLTKVFLPTKLHNRDWFLT